MATWTREVYQLLGNDLDVRVYGSHASAPIQGIQFHEIKGPLGYVRLHRFLRNRRLRGLLDRPKIHLSRAYARRIAENLRRVHPEVVHIHNDILSVVPIRRRLPYATILFHMHNDHFLHCNMEHSIEAIESSSAVYFCSNFTLKKAVDLLGEPLRQKGRVIFNGATIPPCVDKVREAGRPHRILFVGRLVPEKGLHVLLDSLSIVCEKFSDIELVVVGGVHFGSHEETEYLRSLKAKSADSSYKVLFAGPKSHSQVSEYYRNADLVVCPSIWDEPFGMVNVEAMANGAPVVAFAKGGIPEALGNAGLLVQQFTAQALSDAITKLLSDSKFRNELARRGRERAEANFSWDIIARQWMRQLNEW